MRLLHEAGVAGVPGSAFHSDGGEHLVRFCYAKRDEALDEAIARLERWGGA
jgi:aspartate/methionine/tyrosine aminotransferase